MAKVKLSELADDTAVYNPKHDYLRVLTAKDLKSGSVFGDSTPLDGWVVGIPEGWKPRAVAMIEGYIEQECEFLYEDSNEDLRNQFDPLIDKMQAIFDEANVSLTTYYGGDEIEIDVKQKSEDEL